jgi:hypothetical protein
MSNYRAIKAAHWHAQHRGEYEQHQRVSAAKELIDFGILSNRQIAAFTGLTHQQVGNLSGKTARTGGALSVESLPKIIELFEIEARGEINLQAYKDALDAKVSANMLSRILEKPQTTISRYARRAATRD